MRFSNVDHKELHLFAEPALEFLQVPSLGTKRWSCVTAKDQRDRLRPRNEESRTLPSPLSNGSSKSGASLPTAGANVSRAAMNFIISARRSGGIELMKAVMRSKSLAERCIFNVSASIATEIASPQ
jgi:hypothetical protein